MDGLSDIPPITRAYLIAAVVVTGACALDLISPFSLYLSIPRIFHNHEYWRFFTNLVFFSPQFSLDFLFHMFFLVRYCKSLEQGSFYRRPADMVYMLLVGVVLMTIVAPFIGLKFLGSSLTSMMVYIWARRNPYAMIHFLGLFVFAAPFLPWVMLGFSLLFGNPISVDILGIFCGHVYYYLEDVYPRMTHGRRRPLKTPRLLELLFVTEQQEAAGLNMEFADGEVEEADAEPDFGGEADGVEQLAE